MLSVSQGAGIALLILCIAVTGCSFVKLKKEVKEGLESTVIIGRVHANSLGNGPIIVVACSADEKKEIAHYTVLHESGEYELMVGQGKYYVFAYQDKNSNLIYDAGEPAGQYGDPKVIDVPPVGVVFDIDVAIPEKGRSMVLPPGSKIALVKPQKLHSRQAGDITDLDDERFAEEYGKKGFWEPASFFKQLGGNIYFLEKYDPEKIPILFIHGAGGTPRDWLHFANNIDRTRFQPWFYYYPTGSRIDSMSYLLLWKLSTLQAKYQFNKIYMTAHSMGGLVARSFAVNYGEVFPLVDLFISLSTPWGGDMMAEHGVQKSPAVIPSWIDMQPNGEFLKSLYRAKIPDHTSFYMFYGHRGDRSLFRGNNDGTISLSSLLDPRPQSEAKMNYAFNEDHVSILSSHEVLAQYNTILNEFDEKQKESLSLDRGYLKINFTYNYDIDGIRTGPMFLLRPVGKKGADTVIYLNSDDNGRILGPFPSGDYIASMIITAGKSTNKYVPVSIDSNETNEVDFVFRPDGAIRGCVTASMKPEDKSVGMPDSVSRSVDKNIKIQSITLSGNGVHRTLKQIEGEEIISYDYLISRDDVCYNRCYAFFGLPAGEYKLRIKAQGYKTTVKNYSVKPGTLTYSRVTELTPD